MVDLFDELKEDLHQQRLEKLWNRYKYILIGGALAVVIFTAYGSWQKHSDKKHKEETAVKYAKATAIRLDDAERLKIFDEIAKTGSEGYAILSRFKIATLSAKKEKYTEAVKLYDDIAKDVKIPKYYRDLAASKAFFLLTEYNNDDSSIENRYKILSKEDNSWKFAVKTAMAALFLKKNDIEQAKEIFNSLSSEANTPKFTRYRSQKILNSLK